jgi:hypothetical protein
MALLKIDTKIHNGDGTPKEHFFMQSLNKAGKLISEQNLYKANQLLQLAFKPYHPPS